MQEVGSAARLGSSWLQGGGRRRLWTASQPAAVTVVPGTKNNDGVQDEEEHSPSLTSPSLSRRKTSQSFQTRRKTLPSCREQEPVSGMSVEIKASATDCRLVVSNVVLNVWFETPSKVYTTMRTYAQNVLNVLGRRLFFFLFFFFKTTHFKNSAHLTSGIHPAFC